MEKASISSEYLKYYSLEDYLFGEVNRRFHKQGFLNAFDFFCIVIWKANRAKSNIARRMLKKSFSKLNDSCIALTSQISKAPTPQEKMKVMMNDWGFLLPMTSAILSVLYPDDFTVYDVRVCQMLGKYENLKDKENVEKLWPIYQQFIEDVRKATPGITNLRDKDRLLWGKSFHDQLKKDIKNMFAKRAIN